MCGLRREAPLHSQAQQPQDWAETQERISRTGQWEPELEILLKLILMSALRMRTKRKGGA